MTWKGTITLMCDLHFMKRRLIFVLGPFDRWGQGQAAVSIWILGFVSLWGDLFLLDRFPGQLVQIYERSFQAAEENDHSCNVSSIQNQQLGPSKRTCQWSSCDYRV